MAARPLLLCFLEKGRFYGPKPPFFKKEVSASLNGVEKRSEQATLSLFSQPVLERK